MAKAKRSGRESVQEGRAPRETPTASRRPWQTMQLLSLGDIVEIVQGGGGKLSFAGGDPGDVRKAAGQG